MSEPNSLLPAPVNEAQYEGEFIQLIKHGRIITRDFGADYVAVAYGTDKEPAEIRMPTGEVIRGKAVASYGKYPKFKPVNDITP